ncbi:acetolactate synthase small subunit [Kiritimatiella glycovorans]|uniref:Acetolactate synthase small subunit n=1 Tax=Kiritimatiella glycovorans TaxID=1307763 RepID=A0A0G3EJV3_9BACT|nr:acetolactate synthase small subunit [Kiritimatiella glycovorans]AKJ64409.1 Acetolactate synthase small subunit [Kiritimatiella glycovorans]
MKTGGANSREIHALSVYVANKPGVLARVAQVFSRRGFNIESLVVSPAMDGTFSRMTIGVSGESEVLDQLIRKVSKLVDVLHCTDHTYDDTVTKEMALIKLAVGSEDRAEALQISEHFGCKTVDLTENSMILMATGDPEKLDALVGMLSKFRMIELVNTGAVIMSRGEGET